MLDAAARWPNAAAGRLERETAGVESPREIRAGHENGRLVVTVTGLDPDRMTAAVEGFPLTVRGTR